MRQLGRRNAMRIESAVAVLALGLGLAVCALATWLGLTPPTLGSAVGLTIGVVLSTRLVTAGCYSYWDKMGGWLRFGSLVVALGVVLALGTWRFRPISPGKTPAT